MAAMTGALSRHAAFELAVNTALNDFPNVEAIREEQRKCLKHLVDGIDVFAILPTGFGKSLIFQLFSLSHLSPSLAFIFFALLFTSHRSPLSERLEQATFWSKNKGGGGRAPRAPPLDPPPVLVTKLPHPRSNTKILDIALAWGLRTKIEKTVLNHITYRFSLR